MPIGGWGKLALLSIIATQLFCTDASAFFFGRGGGGFFGRPRIGLFSGLFGGGFFSRRPQFAGMPRRCVPCGQGLRGGRPGGPGGFGGGPGGPNGFGGAHGNEIPFDPSNFQPLGGGFPGNAGGFPIGGNGFNGFPGNGQGFNFNPNGALGGQGGFASPLSPGGGSNFASIDPAGSQPAGTGAIPSANPFSPDQSGQLNPQGLNGNMSLEVGIKLDANREGFCQATPVGTKPCRLALAAHCVEDLNGQVLKIRTADFGTVQALVTMHPQYAANSREISRSTSPSGGINILRSYAPHDIALLSFQGEACDRAQVKVIPIGTEAVPENTPLKAASKWHKTFFPAKFSGQISDDARTDVKMGGAGISQGDSGGGLFAELNGVLKLVGVLSTGRGQGGDFSTDAGYTVAGAMRWLFQESNNIAARAGNLPNNPNAPPVNNGQQASARSPGGSPPGDRPVTGS